MNRYLIGALAGFSATAAMTLAVGALYRRLPARERYPLLPREITTKTAAQVGVARSSSEEQRVAATLLSHFGYGAATGAFYPAFAHRVPALSPVLGGVVYGLFVWAVSYLGWLPAFGILRPATEHPPRRNAVMLLAHVVWGGATGAVSDGLERAERTFLASGEMRDAR